MCEYAKQYWSLFGLDAAMVVCSYAQPDGKCCYPSGPCRVGREKREGQLCEGRSPLSDHLPKVADEEYISGKL